MSNKACPHCGINFDPFPDELVAIDKTEWLTSRGEVVKIVDMTDEDLCSAYRLTDNFQLQKEIILRLFESKIEGELK